MSDYSSNYNNSALQKARQVSENVNSRKKSIERHGADLEEKENVLEIVASLIIIIAKCSPAGSEPKVTHPVRSFRTFRGEN